MVLTDWYALTLAEPALAELEQDIVAYRAGLQPMPGVEMATSDEWHLELVWAKAFKPRMEALVGWKCGRACLQSSASYHVAYDRLYGLLLGPVEAGR